MSIVSAAWIAFYLYGKIPVWYRHVDTDTERCTQVHYVPAVLPVEKDHWTKYPWYTLECRTKESR